MAWLTELVKLTSDIENIETIHKEWKLFIEWLTKLVKLTSDKHRNYSLNGMAY